MRIAVSPAPSSRFPFPVTDEEQEGDHCGDKHQMHRTAMRYRVSDTEREYEEPRYEEGPALPCTRQAPSPTIALRSKPISGLVRNHTVGPPPSLHHDLTLGDPLRPILYAGDLVALRVTQLQFDQTPRRNRARSEGCMQIFGTRASRIHPNRKTGF